jgi:hypothetical protein
VVISFEVLLLMESLHGQICVLISMFLENDLVFFWLSDRAISRDWLINGNEAETGKTLLFNFVAMRLELTLLRVLHFINRS